MMRTTIRFIFTVLVIGLIGCSKTIVDTSQVRPAPPHASELNDENGEAGANRTVLFPVGGGATPDSLMRHFLDQSTVENPRLLLIPHAYAANTSSMTAQLTRFTTQFEGLGIERIEGLDLTTGQGALDQINNADIIWISGGLQNTLRNTLNNADSRLVPAIRNRYDQGLSIVGGTSAGAAILSEVMIGGDGGNNASSPGDVSLSSGFGLFPEVIIDQHFTERNRMWRLENAVARNPTLIGIGIDESTAIIFLDKDSLEVVGAGNVIIIRRQGANEIQSVLEAGDVFKF